MQKLETPHLQLLAALQQHGTMSAASAAINLSTSAASRRLQEAERRLSVRLVERRGRTLELTAAGRLIAETAARTSRELSEAEFSARWLHADEQPPIQVGVGFYDHLDWLLPFDEPFELIRSPTALASAAADVDLSIDVVGKTAAASSSSTVGLADDRLVLITSETHPVGTRGPVSAHEITQERYLASSVDPREGFEFERFFLRAGHGPSSILRVESFAAIIQIVARGTGVSIQPYRSVAHVASAGIRISELDVELPLRWQAVKHTSSEDVDAFVDALRT